MQDNGQNPNTDGGRTNGTQRPVPPEQAQESATGWPGVQDIPSPAAERVAPWSAEHFASQPGWAEKEPAGRAPAAAPDPAVGGRHADAAEPWFEPNGLARPYVQQEPQYTRQVPAAQPDAYPAEEPYADDQVTRRVAAEEPYEADDQVTRHVAPPEPAAEPPVDPPAEPAAEPAAPTGPAYTDPYYPDDPYAAHQPVTHEPDPYAPPPYATGHQVSQQPFPPRPEQEQYQQAEPGYQASGYPAYPPPQQGYAPQPDQQYAPPPEQEYAPPPQAHHATPAPPQPAQPMAPPPTAEEFAARRAHKPRAPEATMGVPALIRKVSFGMVSPAPSRRERDFRESVTKVRRNFGGLRQITVVNPKGGAGKTVAVLMTAMTFGQSRGGYVLAWDNNETQGTLGMRAQQDFHTRTVRDVLHDLATFMGVHGRVGDLSSYVRAQGEAMFDVLASDESATAGEMLTAQAFADIREVVSRFYKLIIVDTGNNVRAENWQASIDATDQLVVTMSARGDSAETAARMLDHLEQTGRDQLVRQAITVVSMPASRKDMDLPAIQRHFAARTRQVLVAPYEPLLDSGEPIRYGELSQDSKDAWLKIAAGIAEGL